MISFGQALVKNQLRSEGMNKKGLLSRLSAISLAGILSLGAIACGSGDAQNSTDSQQDTAKQTSETEGTTDAGSVEEVYWFSDVSGWGPANWNGVTSSPVLDAIESEVGVKFNIEQPPTEADTKLGLMIASDDLPDLISISNSDAITQLIDSGKVWTIDELLTQYDPDSHLLKDFPEDIKTALIRKYGAWYSYPSHMNSNDNMAVYPPSSDTYENNLKYGENTAVAFNKTIMDALGLNAEDVQTEDALLKTLEVVKNSGYTVDGQPIYPVMLHGNSWIDSSMDGVMAQSFGVMPVDADGAYRHKELDPAYKGVLKLVQTMLNKGYLDVNTLTIDEPALMTYVETGRVFCWIGNPANSSNKNEIPWVSYGPILAANEARPTVAINQQAGTGWIQTFVSKSCKNPEKLAKLLSFVSTKEALYLNEYGVEGVDYTLDENGLAVRTEAGEKIYEENYQSNMWLWPINNTNFEWGTQAGPTEDSDAYVYSQVSTAIGMYKTTYIYDAALFGFENSTVIEPTSDLGIALSQVDSYLESQKAKIVSTTNDADFEKEYESMIKTLEDYSIHDIDAEYDKKLKEYCETYGETVENVNAKLY